MEGPGVAELSPSGFQPHVLVQCLPPAAVTSIMLHFERSLRSLAAFCISHGYGLFNYQCKSPVLAKCTLQTQQSLGLCSQAKLLTVPVFPTQLFIRKSRVSGKKRQLMLTASCGRPPRGAGLPRGRGDDDARAAPHRALLAEHSLSSTMCCLRFLTRSLDMQPASDLRVARTRAPCLPT